MRIIAVIFAAASILMLGCSNMSTEGRVPISAIVQDDILVPARDTGVQIQVRNKRPAAFTQFSPERTVLFVHGADNVDGKAYCDRNTPADCAIFSHLASSRR